MPYPASDAPLNSQLLASLIDSLGTTAFAPLFLKFCHGLCGATHLSIFGFGKGLSPTLLQAESLTEPPLAATAGQHYLQSLAFRHDPLVQNSPQPDKGFELKRLRYRDISDEAYRQNIYERFQLSDRLSLLSNLSFGWAAINLYRSQEQGEFSDENVRQLQSHGALLISLASRHGQLAGFKPGHANSQGYFQHLLQTMEQELSPRECQVCELALLGLKGTEIAEQMGVQSNTVNTLKKRAYSKLGITSLPQLFIKCLQA